MAAATAHIASSPLLPQHALKSRHRQSSSVADSIAMAGPPSIASDGTSVSGIAAAGLPPYMTAVDPRPDYLSRFNASLVGTNLYHGLREVESGDERNSKDETERVVVTEGAVTFINFFLDKLLHDILFVSRSTELIILRIAVESLLKKNLGKDAVAAADANLEDLLAGESDDEDEPSSSAKFNLERTWKRSRLRVMMRSEKSDFDIDDDEQWEQAESFSRDSPVISLHGEIFLAGVLDYITDQLLTLAITPAANRRRRASKKTPSQPIDLSVLYLEESDLEKGALNSPLDKLWRMWRKSSRSRGFSNTGSPRHDGSFSDAGSPTITRRSSTATPWSEGNRLDNALRTNPPTPRAPGGFVETPNVDAGQREVVPDADEHPEHVIASNIPLPLGERDVDEIEVPGLARDPDEWEDELIEEPRRRSYLAPSTRLVGDADGRPAIGRHRSSSAPHPYARNFPSVDTAMQEVPHATADSPAISTQSDDTALTAQEEQSDVSEDEEQGLAEKDKSLDTPPEKVTQEKATTKTVPSAAVSTANEQGLAREADAQHAAMSESKTAALIGLGLTTAVGAGAVAASSGLRHAQPPAPDSPEPSSRDSTPRPPQPRKEPPIGLGVVNGSPDPSATPSPPPQARSPTADKAISRKEVPSAARIAPAKETSTHGMPAPRGATKSHAADLHANDMRYRAISPGSELSETSEILSPRDFMNKRNLPHTRSTVPPDSLPERLQRESPSRSTAPIAASAQGSNVPAAGIPYEQEEKGLQKIPEAVPVAATTRDDRPPPVRKVSGPAGRLTEDLSRARGGSPKARHSPVSASPAESSPVYESPPAKKEDLRRIAVERNNSSYISLVDETTNKLKPKTPLTSSSITSAEDFDNLLSGGGTIKMTLSPQTVRDSPASQDGAFGSPVLDRSHSSNLAKHRWEADNSPKSASMKSPKSPSAGSSDASRTGRSGSDATTHSRGSVSRPSILNKSSTKTGLMAREAAVQTDSTRDFADFIRSTGPDREPHTLVPSLTNRSSTGNAGRQASVGAQRSGSLGSLPVTAGPQVSSNAGIKYKRSLAPREATGAEGASNAGLIDFIRTGPGNGRDNVASKDIAPFRYSLEDDDHKHYPVTNLDEQSAGRSFSTGHAEIGHRSSISTMGTVQTTNSRAPLVTGRHAPNGSADSVPTPKLYGQSSKQSYTTVGADGITRYRNKDPYAMDVSDDDEAEYAAQSAVRRVPGQKAGTTPDSSGTLGDFMRENGIPSAIVSTNNSHHHNGNKPTGPTMGHTYSGTGYSPSTNSPRSLGTASTSVPLGPRPVVVPAGSPRTTASRPKWESREAGGARANANSTRDLADFFRTSAPPESAANGKDSGRYGGGPSPSAGGRTGGVAGVDRIATGGAPRGRDDAPASASGGKKSKFWSRKRYLDMP